MLTTYLGRESPAVRHLAGRTIPCLRRPSGGVARDRVCDPYGWELGLALLPGGDDLECHDAVGGELFSILQASGLYLQLQPATIFHSCLPPHVFADRGRPPSIVPDAAIHVALPRVATARGVPQPRTTELARLLLFDVKTIHAGTQHYFSAHAAEEQSGAVRHREHTVWPDYQRAARALDRTHHPVVDPVTGRPRPRLPPDGPGPVEQRLESFTATRGLVFGAYSEASVDVHRLLDAAATRYATDHWRPSGARTLPELRSCALHGFRQRLGVATAQAFARSRLARVPYVGVPRQALHRRTLTLGGAQGRARAVRAPLPSERTSPAAVALPPNHRLGSSSTSPLSPPADALEL